jgi:hypothetical protein
MSGRAIVTWWFKFLVHTRLPAEAKVVGFVVGYRVAKYGIIVWRSGWEEEEGGMGGGRR